MEACAGAADSGSGRYALDGLQAGHQPQCYVTPIGLIQRRSPPLSFTRSCPGIAKCDCRLKITWVELVALYRLLDRITFCLHYLLVDQPRMLHSRPKRRWRVGSIEFAAIGHRK